jgi:hypothetical protein
VYSSHVAFFQEFFNLLGFDISLFGLPVAQGGYSVEEEETVMSAFAVHVWRHPRRVVRGGTGRNTGRHCQACVGAARDWLTGEHRRVVAPPETSPFLARR